MLLECTSFSLLWKWTLTCGPKVPYRRLLVNTWMYKRGMGTMVYFALWEKLWGASRVTYPFNEWSQAIKNNEPICMEVTCASIQSGPFFFLALENKQQTHCTLASWLTLVICFLACQPGFWVLQLESLRQQIVNQCTLSNWLYCLSLYSRWLTYESVANFTRRGRQTSSSRKCLLTCLSIILSFLLLVWWGTLNWTHYDMGWMMQTYIGLIKLIALLSP